MLNIDGVVRDTENGHVITDVTLMVVGGGKLGLQTHVFGLTTNLTTQVSSPIREITISECGKFATAITRSYNKYIFALDDIVNFDGTEMLIRHWLDGKKIIRFVSVDEIRSGNFPKYTGDIHPIERMKYFGG